MKKLTITVLFFFLLVSFARTQTDIILDAGNDTTICIGTSVQLNAFLTDTTVYQTTTYQLSTIPHNPYPYAGVNANVNTDDQVYGPFDIGFTFCFFGNVYTEFFLGANGWIGFSGAPGSPGFTGYDPWVTTTIPNVGTGTPKDCIMGPWKDWHPGVGPSVGNYVLYQTVGTAPNRKLVVSYNNIPMFSCTNLSSKFQIVLHETTNIIDNHMTSVTVCPGWNSGNGVQGIHNSAGTVAYVVPGRNCTQFTATNDSKRYSPSGPAIPWLITWYDPNGAIGTGNSLVVTPTQPQTTYICQLPGCGTGSTATFFYDSTIVTLEPCGFLTKSSTMVNCYGASTGTATVIIHDGIAPFTYTWSNGVVVQNVNDTISTITGLAAGTYYVTVSTLNGAYDLYETIMISQNQQMFIETTSLPETCPGASDGIVTVMVTNGTQPYIYSIFGFNPSQPQSGTSYTFNGIPTGYYACAITDVYGCQITGSVNVSQLSLSFTTNQNSLLCYGDENGFASISVTGGTMPYSYQWSTGQSTQGVTGLGAGFYTVTVLDDHNCQISSSFTFDQPDQVLIYTSDDQTICLSQSASVVTACIGGVQPYIYHWFPGGYASNMITIEPADDIEYCVYVTDANGCNSNERCVSVFVNPALQIDAWSNKDTICLGDTVVLNAQGSGGNGGPYFYEIYNGPMILPPYEVYPDQTKKYIIICSDGCGTPTIADTVKITVMYPPPINFTADVVSGCPPLTVTFNEETADQGQSYYWDFNDAGFFNYSVLKTPLHVFRNSGLYDITLSVTSPEGCSRIYTHDNMIEVFPQPTSIIEAKPDLVSVIEPVITFENLSLGADKSFWSFGDGDSVMVTTPLPHEYPPVAQTYIVTLITENNDGCRDTAYYEVKVEEDKETFYIPNALNPFSLQDQNKVFRPVGMIEADDYFMTIYDRWGEVIFESNALLVGWEGKNKSGKLVESGVYTYLINFKDKTGKKIQKAGTVTLYY